MALDKLKMLQLELDMHTLPTGRQEQLEQLLAVAASKLAQTGISVNDDDPLDVKLQVDYAAWMFRRRARKVTVMPEYLRADIHDRLISEKARVTDGEP